MRMLRIVSRIPHYFRVITNLKSDEVILASYPKSGNTWIRNIIANYIGMTEMNQDLITFSDLDRIMPGLGSDVYFEEWDYKIPKFSATHLPYSKVLKVPKKVLVIRDPRDVMVSYYHYINKKKNQYHFESVYDLMIHTRFGLEKWFSHTLSWAGKTNYIVVYETMLKDDVKHIYELFDALRINYDRDSMEKAVKNSRFSNFTKIEKEFGHSKPDENKDDFQFARKGVAGDYVNYFDSKCYALYDHILEKYGFESYQHILKELLPSDHLTIR